MSKINSVENGETTGKWEYPPLCKEACIYKAQWKLDPEKDVIKFVVETYQRANTWTGIGFTDHPDMVETYIRLS